MNVNIRAKRAMKTWAALGASALLLAPATASAVAAVEDDTATDTPIYPNADTGDDDPGNFFAELDFTTAQESPLSIAGEILNDEILVFESGLLEGAARLPKAVSTRVADETVYLTWPSSGASLYSIAAWETADPSNRLKVKNVGGTKATFDNLENGVDYTFVVVGAGMSGATSYEPVQATPVGIAPMPTSPPRLVSSDDSSITVSLRPLRDRTVGGYQVKATEVATGNTYTATTTDTSRPTVKVTGLKPNTEYELVYAGMSYINQALILGPYSEASLTVVTNDTTAPTSVTVTSERNSRVDLSWDAVEGATKYIVYYDEVSDPYGEEFTIEVPGTTASVTGLTNGTDYEFEVAAEIERDGQLIVGDRSDPVYGTPAGPLPPSDFRINHPANGAMFFDWNAVSGVEGYMIATEVFDARGVDNPNVPDPVFIAAHDGEMDAKVEGLTNDVEYRFRIASVLDDAPGEYTTDENSPLGVPMAVPGATDPTASQITKSSVTVTYPAPPVTEGASRATKYEVTLTPANGEPFTVESTDTTATADGLTEGVTYTVSVRAGNKAGYGPPSPNPIQVTTADKPGVAQNLTVTRSGDGTSANLSWDAPAPDPSTSAPSAYKVDANPITPGDPDPGSQTVTDLAASFSGLAATGDYIFTVTGITEAGPGPVASAGSIGTLPTPSAVSYGYDNNSVSFSFPAPAGMYTSQARATQQATPGDAALMAAIRDGKADQLIDNQLAVVDPSSLTCTDGTCTAVFENFADNLNGDAWTFQVRTVDGNLSSSNWVDAAVTPVADAATATTDASEDTKAPCLPDAVETPDGKCREFMNYTYSTDVETKPYTFHKETRWDTRYNPNGDLRTDVDPHTWTCPYGWDAGGGMWGDGICKKPVEVDVKDPPPSGWYDNGTAYAKNTAVKDPTPEGWTDDGSRWTRVVEQFTSECPAGTVLQPDDSCREFQDYTYETVKETKPYTYHDEKYVDTKNNPNGDCTDAPGYWTWTCPAGYTAGGGQWGACICKGEQTSRVKDAPPAGWYDNGSAYERTYQRKNPTPEGWTDDGTQWYRDVSSAILRDYFVESTFPWTAQDRAANGIVNMLVGGNIVTDGKSPLLGRCPGTVPVTVVGLAGSTSTTYELCN